MSPENLVVLAKTIMAVESGGQVYGRGRYNAYAGPYTNSQKEVTITLGALQAYGHQAQDLVKMIYLEDPDAFDKLDNAGIKSMLSKDWESIGWNPTAKQKSALIAIIDSPIGHKCQDELLGERCKSMVEECAKLYPKADEKAQMMYAEIRHLGGLNPTKRIFNRCGGNYSLDNIMASLVKDQSDTSSDNQVGDKKYWSRHVKCRQFIDEHYIGNITSDKKETTMSITEKDIIICGHGSGNPRTIRMDTYLTSRYKQKASNGKRKGVVAVKRLKSLTDAGRIKYHDKYKTILGRNKYSQNKRSYCYKKYSDGKYYSDCSSSQCLTFSEIGYDCPDYNTAGIYNSSRFETVNVNIVNGHITNPEILKVGDQLLFVGNDPSRPLQIGHVEGIYEISGQDNSESISLVKQGQKQLNNFLADFIKQGEFDALVVDGDFGKKTMKNFIRAFQYGMNKSYKVGLEVDGIYGQMSKAAARNYPTRQGQKSYVVTVLEIGMLLRGIDPNGVEYPGIYGSGLASATEEYLGYTTVREPGWTKLFTL